MRTASHSTRLTARHLVLGLSIAAMVGGTIGCSDATRPVAPPDDPALAANTTGPLAVKSVIGLEPLIGATIPASDADDINDLGQAVGWSSAPGGERHAVLWEVTTSVFPIDLGTLPGGIDSEANAINSAGTVIVGRSMNASFEERAVRWVFANGSWLIQDLGALTGQTFAEAHDVAEDGTIVGTWFPPPGQGTRAFVWQNGIMSDLGADEVRTALGLNEIGQVVGGNFADHAVLWTAGIGAMEIGTLGGSASLAYDINASGEITGSAVTTSNLLHAFLWTPRKGMIDLGTLGGSSSSGRALNAAGQVVGESLTTANEAHAFLWAKGKMLDLGVLPGHGESGARAINNEKQVVGHSLGGGLTRATLWTIK